MDTQTMLSAVVRYTPAVVAILASVGGGQAAGGAIGIGLVLVLSAMGVTAMGFTTWFHMPDLIWSGGLLIVAAIVAIPIGQSRDAARFGRPGQRR